MAVTDGQVAKLLELEIDSTESLLDSLADTLVNGNLYMVRVRVSVLEYIHPHSTAAISHTSP